MGTALTGCAGRPVSPRQEREAARQSSQGRVFWAEEPAVQMAWGQAGWVHSEARWWLQGECRGGRRRSSAGSQPGMNRPTGPMELPGVNALGSPWRF